MVRVDIVGTDHLGENCELLYNPGQRWYWLSEQMAHELLLFSTFDEGAGSELSCESFEIWVMEYHPMLTAVVVPHASFRSGHDLKVTHPRESVELRLIVGNKIV